jgi:energy-coupling factor transport system permease protein
LLEPLTPDPRAPLAAVHPLAKIAAGLVVMLALFLTLDPLTPALVLIAVLVAVPLIGVPPGPLARRAAPLLVASAGIAFFNSLVTGDVGTGFATGIRLAGIGLAGVVAIASVDPTELADALVEHLHAPHRFTVGALAAFRLLPLFADEWQTIGLARRARGLDDRGGPIARVRAFFATTRALLIAAIRRATRLALAMDGRGFADASCRTLARPRPIGARDWSLIGAAIAIAALASAASIAVGSWRSLLSG